MICQVSSAPTIADEDFRQARRSRAQYLACWISRLRRTLPAAEMPGVR